MEKCMEYVMLCVIWGCLKGGWNGGVAPNTKGDSLEGKYVFSFELLNTIMYACGKFELLVNERSCSRTNVS